MNSWFRCIKTQPHATARLICFPHAGGSAVSYLPWHSQLSPAVEMHAVQYPGRADRINEAPIDDAMTIVRFVVAELTPLLDRPIVLFGHSMGAMIAYEVARALQASGAAPVHLFISACRAVDDPGYEAVSEWSDSELVDELIRLGGTDAEVLADPDLRELVLPYVRADFHLIETYEHKPEPMLSVPVTALVGTDDQMVTREQIARWAGLTSGTFVQRVLPGDHFYLVERQDQVIAEISARITGL